ncbi:ISNCY family transposase, partial [Cupriavidus necator]
GAALPYTTYDRLGEIDQGAIVEHKRLGHVLAIAAQVQAQRDSRQQTGPSRTLAGAPPRPHRPAPNTKRQRLINRLDLERALAAVPRNPDTLDISAWPARVQPPHPGPDSATSGQHHRPTEKARKEHDTAQKARSD